MFIAPHAEICNRAGAGPALVRLQLSNHGMPVGCHDGDWGCFWDEWRCFSEAAFDKKCRLLSDLIVNPHTRYGILLTSPNVLLPQSLGPFDQKLAVEYL